MTDAFYGPRSRENARLLLDAATALDIHPREIRTQAGGYLVPEAVVDYIDAKNDAALESEAADGAETAPDAPDEGKGGQEADGGAEAQDAPAKRPSVTEPKADWLAYANHLALDVTDENTKAEIIEAVKKTEEEAD